MFKSQFAVPELQEVNNIKAAPNIESHDTAVSLLSASNFGDEIPGLVPFERNQKGNS
jgi:hypothetical protein